jgi:CRISPR type III-A/MTUBE-associated protein Csm6
MGKTILFSPVGGTDPMSQNNYHDGSMVHICRVYKPDVIYLYMSNEMLEFQRTDNRYLYCLEKLEEKLGFVMEKYIIERPELKEVQRFDDIYRDFGECIKTISAQMEDDDKLILNISSGTPAMKSSLFVMNVLGEYDFTAVQVSTPEKSINEHNHHGYDVELLWEMNEDNNDNFINRCSEAYCPALLNQKKLEMVKRHVDSYDYSAALEILNDTNKGKSTEYTNYLLLAKKRMELDFSVVSKLEKELNIDCTPVKSGDAKKLFEYALSLQIKQKKKEYADFLRALTPIIVDLFEKILHKQCGVNLDDYTRTDNKGARRWNREKLENDNEILNILLNKYSEFSFGYVYSDSIRELIVSKTSDPKLAGTVDSLRNIEEKIRNIAAHQIVSVNDEVIRQKTGF